MSLTGWIDREGWTYDTARPPEGPQDYGYRWRSIQVGRYQLQSYDDATFTWTIVGEFSEAGVKAKISFDSLTREEKIDLLARKMNFAGQDLPWAPGTPSWIITYWRSLAVMSLETMKA